MKSAEGMGRPKMNSNMSVRTNSLKKVYETIDGIAAEEKMKNIPQFPKIIEFEVTNHCNFHCLMCKTGVGTSTRKRGYMSNEVYDTVIEEIKGHPIVLKFVGQGEPLMHPHFIEYVKKAKAADILVHITTNGSLLTETMMKELIEIEVDSIKFSFQGVDAAGYFQLRQRDNYEELLRKIEQLYQLRGDKPYPYITVGTSCTSESPEQVAAFKSRCSRLCDKVEVGITTLEFIELDKIKDEKVREQLKVIQKQQNQKKKRYRCCPQIFDTIAVRWNGDITACCADLDGLMTLGNIQEDSILDCWYSEQEGCYREILSRCEYDKLPLCKDCYDVYGWSYGENK